MFEPAAYASLRRDRLTLHFQYLMASQRKVDYDYFSMTAGGMMLSRRFEKTAGITAYDRFRPTFRGRRSREGPATSTLRHNPTTETRS
jgi:hypothetical protein